MALDLEKLLGSFGDDEPSGPDCEYDPAYADLEIAAAPKSEVQIGDQVNEAEEADYAEVIKLAPELLERTKDLRVAVLLAEATVNREGFAGFAQVLEYMHRSLVEYWDSVHPQLDADDDNDPTERVNALKGLIDEQRILRQVRRASLTEGKVMGRFSLRHLAVARGEMPMPSDMEAMPDEGAINAAFQDTPAEKMQEIRDGLRASFDHVSAIEALLDEKTPGNSPDMEPLRGLLKIGMDAANAAIGEPAGDATDETPSEGSAGTSAAPVAGQNAGGVGGVNSANDVKRTIDLILDYYKRAEPSSPVPIILARAKRLVGADFMTIVKDMAASAEEEVRTIGGITDDEEY